MIRLSCLTIYLYTLIPGITHVYSLCLNTMICNLMHSKLITQLFPHLFMMVLCTYRYLYHQNGSNVHNTYAYINVHSSSRVLPRINIGLSGWVWFGQSLWPHQSLWLPHQRNEVMEGMGGRYAERAWGEHWVVFKYTINCIWSNLMYM